jgi:glutamate-1-semialdehyde aminotransferase
MIMRNSQVQVSPSQVYLESLDLIPGGTQLFSKKPELFNKDFWPIYFNSAKGISIKTSDGRILRDMSHMGVGSCVLGYSDKFVSKKVKSVINAGVQSTLIAPEEIELAEKLVEIHPWAQMVRFARSGGEAMSIAVRISRVCTGKDVVLFSGYHGWADWYVAANLSSEDQLSKVLLPGLSSRGIPAGLADTAIAFEFNDIDRVRKLVQEYSGRIASIVMEPRRSEEPLPGYLEEIRAICSREGIVLIFDEITTGWRACSGGIHLNGNVKPDIAVFAKAMANGHAMSAIIGTREVMEYANASFISSTNWTERIGPTAALATIEKYKKYDVQNHLAWAGELVSTGWKNIAESCGIVIDANDGGLPALSRFSFKYPFSRGIDVLFCQLMLEKGWLAHNQFKPSLAHTKKDIEQYLVSVEQVFNKLAVMIKTNEGFLVEMSDSNPAPSIPRLTK